MRKQLMIFTLVAVAFAMAAPSAARAQSSRPTVAILDLDYGSIQDWWGGNWDIGKGVADLIVDELVNDGSYRLIERKRLDAILAEQEFSNSDRADPDAKAVSQIGKALGVKYLIVGSITKFGTEKKDVGIGGGGWGGGGFGLGKIGTTEGKATVALALRIIDTSTGEIMASAKGQGTSKRSGLLLGGGGGNWHGAGVGEINMGSSEYRETILGEATEIAVKDVSGKLINAKGRLGN